MSKAFFVGKIVFVISFLYYIFWIAYAIRLSFVGIDAGWIAPALSSGEMHYGIDAFVDGLLVGFFYTILLFWFIPLYQVVFAIICVVRKLSNGR